MKEKDKGKQCWSRSHARNVSEIVGRIGKEQINGHMKQKKTWKEEVGGRERRKNDESMQKIR